MNSTLSFESWRDNNLIPILAKRGPPQSIVHMHSECWFKIILLSSQVLNHIVLDGLTLTAFNESRMTSIHNLNVINWFLIHPINLQPFMQTNIIIISNNLNSIIVNLRLMQQSENKKFSKNMNNTTNCQWCHKTKERTK